MEANNEGTITHSPEVLELLEGLRTARESDAGIAADLAQAESVLADLTTQRHGLAAQLKASEDALALSGALPVGPFPEERDLQDVDRRIRVAESRVRLIGGKLAESHADIDCLKNGLRRAFGQFITTHLAEVRARYRTAAVALRNIYAEQFPFLHTAQLIGLKVPPADMAIIADPEAPPGKNEILDARRMVSADAVWQEFSGPLHVRLTALHAEVFAAIEGTKAPRAARVAAAPTQSFGPGSLETLALAMEGGGGSVIGARPADGGAPLPDLAEHGIGGAGNPRSAGASAGSPVGAIAGGLR